MPGQKREARLRQRVRGLPGCLHVGRIAVQQHDGE
jgi:hypothetical protein